MNTGQHESNRELITRLQEALYDVDPVTVKHTLKSVLAPDCLVHMCAPFGDIQGPEAWFANVFQSLFDAIPDIERREYIRVAGTTPEGDDWVGCAGFYAGTFARPWLDIPPTGHLVTMRYHEFYRVVEAKVVEVQALWDIPDLMRQASAWPMAPSLGREIHVPGPASNDGVASGVCDESRSEATRQHIIDMLTDMTRHPQHGGPELMQMNRYWHPKMNWYGPSGIGSCRGIDGFRRWHQIPFLRAMPDRGQDTHEICHHFFAEGDYAAVTGWPNMAQHLSHDGWLGIAPSGQKLYLRSLDFWRLENGLIRENWVLVDLLDIYAQLGVNVLDRVREFNQARFFSTSANVTP